MCGIAGIFSSTPFDQLAQQQPELSIGARLLAMQSALTHRGPDGQGSYICPSQCAALSHTRLAIIDLTDAGHQPMSVGSLTISFNGEIYNYKNLRRELEKLGESFNSDSDTEVILKLYLKFGRECVKKLRGMFAFTIWNSDNKTAFAARDPLGIKPLYYWKNNEQLAFSSEIRSLLAAELSSRAISSDGLRSYLKTGTVSEPNSLIDDIKMLPAGHFLEWRNGNASIEQYWQLNFTDNQLPDSTTEYGDIVELTRNALIDSVKAHFVSDVPVGLFLSGGIDSTALLALAKQVTDNTINTYSIAFENPEWNEGDIAKRVAQKFNTNHTEFLMTPEQAKPLFKEFLASIDQPTIDGFNTFCVSKLASECGEKVVLSGLGGDELFAGYASFEKLPTMHKYAGFLAWLAPLLNKFNKRLSTRLRRITDYLNTPASLAVAYNAFRGVFSHSECHDIASSIGLVKPSDATHANITSTTNRAPLADQISTLELEGYMRNQLLRDSDVMSMAHGLELRVPFVDSNFIDTVSTIPAKWRLQFGKQLLVDAVPELPEWVVNRPKQGFRFPFDEWFSDNWQQMPSPASPQWIKLTPWYRRWSLSVLNHWLTEYRQKP